MASLKFTYAIRKALFWLFLIHLLAIPGYFLIYERFAPLDFIGNFFKTNFLFWSWANFDGEHYLSIAKFGYQIRNGFPQYAFFPLYPVLIKAVQLIVRDYLVAGLLVSFAALVVILKYLPKKLHLPLLLAPGAVFLAAVYTEPLFIALAAMVFHFAGKKDWQKAAVFAALASAARVNGVFVVLFLLVSLWEAKAGLKKIIGYGLLSVSGLVSYMTYLYFKTGDFLAFYHSQAYWGKATATSPWVTFVNYLKAVSTEFKPDLVHLVVVFEVAITLWAIYLVVTVIRKRMLSLPYYLYLLGNLALPLITGSLGSMPRFFLLLFPSFAVIPTLPVPVRRVVYTVYSLIMVTGVILFTRGHWFA